MVGFQEIGAFRCRQKRNDENNESDKQNGAKSSASPREADSRDVALSLTRNIGIIAHRCRQDDNKRTNFIL